MFPVAATLTPQASADDLMRALDCFLDTVVVPVEQNNWRRVRDLMNRSQENGWGLRFVLWAKGARVKSVPLHHFAQHPCLLGWIAQDIDDLGLLAMLRATTETGQVWSWQTPSPFTKGTIAPQPTDHPWWAWVSAEHPEDLLPQAARALLAGANGICFSRLPANEEDVAERERQKALAFFAVHLRLWQTLLNECTTESGWEWREENLVARIWELREREWVCLFAFPSPAPQVVLSLPFSTPERVRAYAVQFPAMVRLPLQRKGERTVVRWETPSPLAVLWLTETTDRVQQVHQRANELLPKAMQFAVQWVLARRERFEQQGIPLPETTTQLWEMLQKARRRQFSHGYLLAQQLLTVLDALPSEGTSSDASLSVAGRRIP